MSRSASFFFSHARISSIFVSTNRARRRLSFGSIGGYLVSKFVKQTTINPRFAHESGFGQGGLVEAEPKVRTGCTRVLRKANTAMRQEKPGLDPSDRVLDQG